MSASRIITAVIGIVAVLIISQSNRAQESNAVAEVSEPSVPVATQMVSEADIPESDIVVVSASRIPQAIRDLGVSVSVVPRERIEELNAQNVGEVLAEVTDARVNSYGSMGAESEITLRGSSGNQVLVMVDGRPVNVASVGKTDLSMYPLIRLRG